MATMDPMGYPAVREVVPDGDEIADHEIEEHAEAERTMKRLESADPFEDLGAKLARGETA